MVNNLLNIFSDKQPLLETGRDRDQEDDSSIQHSITLQQIRENAEIFNQQPHDFSSLKQFERDISSLMDIVRLQLMKGDRIQTPNGENNHLDLSSQLLQTIELLQKVAPMNIDPARLGDRNIQRILSVCPISAKLKSCYALVLFGKELTILHRAYKEDFDRPNLQRLLSYQTELLNLADTYRIKDSSALYGEELMAAVERELHVVNDSLEDLFGKIIPDLSIKLCEIFSSHSHDCASDMDRILEQYQSYLIQAVKELSGSSLAIMDKCESTHYNIFVRHRKEQIAETIQKQICSINQFSNELEKFHMTLKPHLADVKQPYESKLCGPLKKFGPIKRKKHLKRDVVPYVVHSTPSRFRFVRLLFLSLKVGSWGSRVQDPDSSTSLRLRAKAELAAESLRSLLSPLALEGAAIVDVLLMRHPSYIQDLASTEFAELTNKYPGMQLFLLPYREGKRTCSSGDELAEAQLAYLSQPEIWLHPYLSLSEWLKLHFYDEEETPPIVPRDLWRPANNIRRFTEITRTLDVAGNALAKKAIKAYEDKRGGLEVIESFQKGEAKRVELMRDMHGVAWQVEAMTALLNYLPEEMKELLSIKSLADKMDELFIECNTLAFQLAVVPKTIDELQQWTKGVETLAGHVKDLQPIVRVAFEQAVQEIGEYESLREFVEDLPTGCVSDKFLLHMTGDSFGKSANLGEYRLDDINSLLLRFVSKRLHQTHPSRSKPLLAIQSLSQGWQWTVPLRLTKDHLERIVNKLVQCQKLNTALFSAQNVNQQEEPSGWFGSSNKKSPIEVLKETFSCELKKLHSGESFSFPLSCISADGQETICELILQPNGQLTVCTYNGGSADTKEREYYGFQAVGIKSKVLTRVTRVNVPIEQFLGPVVLQALYDLTAKNHPSEFWTGREWHEGVLPLLGEPAPSTDIEEDELKTGRRSETGAMHTMLQMISKEFKDRSVYKRWRWELRLKAIVEHFSQYQHRYRNEEIPRRLISLCIEKVARETDKSHQAGLINTLEYSYTKQWLEKISAHLKTIENELIRERESQAPRLDLSPIAQTNRIDFTVSVDIKSVQTSAPPALLCKRHLPLGWQPNQETLFKTLRSLIKQMGVSIGNKEYYRVQESMVDSLLALPFKWDFWDRLSSDEAIELVQLFNEMSTHFLSSFFGIAKLDSKHGNKVTPAQLLAAIKALSLSHKVMKNISGNLGLDQADLYSPEIEQFCEKQAIYIHTFNPLYDEQMEELASYWNAQKGVQERRRSEKGKRTIFFQALGPKSSWEGDRFISERKDALWIERCLKERSDVRDAFLLNFPDFASLSPFQQICLAYSHRCEINGNVREGGIFLLPSYFFNLYHLTLVAHFLTDYPIDAKFKFKEPAELTIVTSLRGTHEAKINVSVRGSNLEDILTSGLHCPETSEHLKRTAVPIPEEVAIFYIENGPLRSLGIPAHLAGGCVMGNEEIRCRRAPNEKIPPVVKSLPLEIAMELCAVSAHAAFQIPCMAAFFRDHADLLEQKAYRILFEKLLFEPGLLLNALRNSPIETARLGDTLRKLILGHIELSITKGELDAALWGMTIDRLLVRYLSYALRLYPSHFPDKYTLISVDHHAIVNDLLTQFSPKQIEYPILNFHRVLSYGNQMSFTLQEIEAILGSYLCCQVYSPQEIKNNPSLEEDARQIVERALLSLPQNLSDTQMNDLLNRILAYVDTSVLDRKWDISRFPLCLSHDGIACQLEEGLMFQKGEKICKLPHDIVESVEFEAVFGKRQTVNASGLEWGLFSVVDKERWYCIRGGAVLGTARPTIQREINQEWYQRLTEEELTAKGGNLPVSFLHRSIWYSSSSGHFYVGERETDRLLYEGIRQDRGWEIYQLNEKEERTKLVLIPLHLNQTPFAFFENLVPLNEIFMWNEVESNTIKQIGFPTIGPRPGLTFEVRMQEGRMRAYCTTIKGYFIAEKQFLPSLGTYRHFLLLENRKGEQLVLLPMQQLINSKSTTSSLQIGETERSDVKLFGQLYHRFSTCVVDTKTGELIPPSGLERFHLAMIYLFIQDYPRTKCYLRAEGHLLREQTSQVIPLSNEERFLLESIALQKENKHLDHPQALALACYASYLLMRDSKMQGLPNVGSEEYLQDQMSRYLNQLNNVGLYALHAEEELFLLTLVVKYAKAADATVATRIYQIAPQYHERIIIPPSDTVDVFSLPAKPHTVERDFVFDRTVNNAWNGSPLLRPYRVCDDFVEYYRIMRNGVQWASVTEITEFMGFTRPAGVSNQQLIRECATALQVMHRLALTRYEESKIAFLEAVLHNPDLFPSYKDFTNIMSNDTPNDRVTKDKLINIAQEILKSIQKEPSANHPSPSILVKRTPLPGKKVKDNDISPSPRLTHSAPSQIFNLSLMDEVNEISSKLLNSTYQHAKELMESEELQKLFSSHSEDLEMKKVSEAIKKYSNSHRTLLRYTLSDFNAFKGSYLNLKYLQLPKLCAQLADETITLLQLVNRPYHSPLDQLKNSMSRIGMGHCSLTLDEIIVLYLHQNPEKFRELRSDFTDGEMQQIVDQIQKFLLLATYIKQIEELCALIDALIMAHERGEPLEERIQAVGEQVHRQRAYSVHQHPEYLVFEYYSELLLHPTQVEMLNTLSLEKGTIHDRHKLGTVIELIMGSGKTTVIFPLLAHLLANGENLVVCVVPEKLFRFISRDFAKRLGKSFDQIVQVFAFSRESKFDRGSLTGFYKELQKMIEQKKILFLTSESLYSFYLSYHELLWKLHETNEEEDSSEVLSCLEVYREIFRLLSTNGELILDEADFLLRAMKEFLYAVGQPTPIQPIVYSVVCHFYDLVLRDPRFRPLFSYSFSPQPKASVFEEGCYEKKMREPLIEALIDSLGTLPHPEIQEYGKKLKPEERSLVKDFLNNGERGQHYIDALKDPLVQDALTIMREEVQTVFPLTANSNVLEHYGPLPEPSQHSENVRHLAVPYLGSNNPQLKSQFRHVLELINKTIQMVEAFGLPREVVLKELNAIRTSAAEEMRCSPEKRLVETQAYKQFLNLIGPENANTFIFAASERHLDYIVTQVNANPTVRTQILQKQILKLIQNYDVVLRANPQIFGFLFKRVQGGTGTAWNAATFPENLQTEANDLSMGKTLTILWQNSPRYIIPMPKLPIKANVAERINSIYVHPEEGTSIIDMAAELRGISNHDVARAMLAHPVLAQQQPPITVVGYYDDTNEKMAIVKDQPDPIPFDLLYESLRIPQEELLVFRRQIAFFWDQQRCTGADVRMHPEAKARVTVGRHNTLRDLLQSVWRLREIDKQQRVTFFISHKERAYIAQELATFLRCDEEKQITLDNMMLYLTFQQGRILGEETLRSYDHKLQAVLQGEFHHLLLDNTLDHSNLKEIVDAFPSLIVQKTSDRPYAQFGKFKKEQRGDQAVQELMIRWREGPEMDTFMMFADRVNVNRMDKELNALADKHVTLVPKKIKGWSEGLRTEVQVQQQTETQTQQQTETQTQQQTETQAKQQTEIQTQTQSFMSLSDYNKRPLPHIEWNLAKGWFIDYWIPCSIAAAVNEGASQDFSNFAHYMNKFRDKDRATCKRIENLFYGGQLRTWKPVKPIFRVVDLLSEFPVSKKKKNHRDEHVQLYKQMYPDGTDDMMNQMIETYYPSKEKIKETPQDYQSFAKIFDPHLLCSGNLTPIYAYNLPYNVNFEAPNPYLPFYPSQKSSSNVLIIQHLTGVIELMMLASDDVPQFQDWLLEDVQQAGRMPEKKKEVRLALCNLTMGIWQQGKERIDEEELQNNSSFQMLKVQAKFFNGHVNYSTEELKCLRLWMEQYGANDLYRFMKEVILKYKDYNSMRFPRSNLAKLFHELGIPLK